MADPDYARIKRNITKMISLGAPEADIDAYVASENVTPEQLRSGPRQSGKEDPITSQVRKEVAEESAELGGRFDPGHGRLIAQGATLGTADEILAGMQTPIEMWKRGTWNPVEGYNYAKAREDVLLENARQRTGATGQLAEMAGGVVSGIGLTRALPALSSGASLASRLGRTAAEGAGVGGLMGVAQGSGTDRLTKALQGATIGGIAGPVIQGGAAAVGAVASPVVSALKGYINPQGYAVTQLARALQRRGMTPDELADDVALAAREGQGVYTVADALGNPGQRLASVVARNPGEGRTRLVEALEQRQAGQGRRVAQQLAEGFDAPRTAAREHAQRTAVRSAEADRLYSAAREQAGPVDVGQALAQVDEFLRPIPVNPGSGIADNSIAAAVRRAQSYLADGRGSQVVDFSRALYAKREIDAMIENGSPSIQRALIPIRNALDESLAGASGPYAAARDAYRTRSGAIDAIDEGRDMYMRGRTEDTIPRFQNMSPDEQAAARVGYADPAIAQVQGAAEGVNKARPFTSDAYRDEFAAMAAPGRGERLARQLERENTMHRTAHQAMGGSRTADNLSDNVDYGVDPSILAALLRGNVTGAAQNLAARTGASVSGNTEATRDALARLLLMSGNSARQLPPVVAQSTQQQVVRDRLTQALLGLARTGAVIGGASALR